MERKEPFKLVKSIYKTPTVNIPLNDQVPDAFPVR